jgi:signal transduction histidine kinase
VLADLRCILDQATPELLSADPPPLSSLINRLREAAGEVTLEVDLDAVTHAPTSVRSAIASFIGEGIRNARKHADPTFVRISSELESGVLRVRVENDGVRRAEDGRGVGLRLVGLDAHRLGGSLATSQTEETWQLMLTLPIASLS